MFRELRYVPEFQKGIEVSTVGECFEGGDMFESFERVAVASMVASVSRVVICSRFFERIIRGFKGCKCFESRDWFEGFERVVRALKRVSASRVVICSRVSRGLSKLRGL